MERLANLWTVHGPLFSRKIVFTGGHLSFKCSECSLVMRVKSTKWARDGFPTPAPRYHETKMAACTGKRSIPTISRKK